jgi:hypothetical protein
MTHPHVMAARGMTRASLDWLNGEGVDCNGSPFGIQEPAARYADTPTYWATVHATGVDPVQAAAMFDLVLFNRADERRWSR